MTKILKISKNVLHQGEKLLGFFLPTLEKPLCIPYSDLRATSSYVEEDFKDFFDNNTKH